MGGCNGCLRSYKMPISQKCLANFSIIITDLHIQFWVVNSTFQGHLIWMMNLMKNKGKLVSLTTGGGNSPTINFDGQIFVNRNSHQIFLDRFKKPQNFCGAKFVPCESAAKSPLPPTFILGRWILYFCYGYTLVHVFGDLNGTG